MCSNPLPSNRGAYCIGYSFDQKSCNNSFKICNNTSVNGAWSNWTEVKKKTFFYYYNKNYIIFFFF